MQVNFFSKINIDAQNLSEKLGAALDQEGYYFSFKWNKGPAVILFQLDLFNADTKKWTSFLGDDSPKSSLGDITIYLGGLPGLKKGKINFSIRAIDEVKKCAVFLIKEGTASSVISRLPKDENDFLSIDANKDLDKTEIEIAFTN